MGAKVRTVFDGKAMGDVFLRSPGTRSLVLSTAREIASRAGHGCRAHGFEGRDGERPMAAVWTRARTPKSAAAAKRALEGAVH